MSATSRGRPGRGLPAAYWRVWSASAISNLGDGISFVAVPLLALSLTDDTRLLALTTAAVFVPWLLVALPAGLAVDRVDRRQLMIVSNVVRAALFGFVAVAAHRGWLSVWGLIALLLVIGTFEVLFDSSAQALMPMIVPPERLATANGLLFTAEIVAGSIAGLSVGAVLFDVATPLPFSIDAATFAVGAVLIASVAIRRSERPVDATGGTGDGLLVAGRWLWQHGTLRTLALLFTVTNLGLLFGQGVFVKYAVEELGASPMEFGIMLAVAAVGGATGGLVSEQVIARLGDRRVIAVSSIVFGLGNIAIGVSPATWFTALAGFAVGAAITIWNVITVTLRQRLIPADLFGRVNGVYRWLGAAASAIGVAAGGLVAHVGDVRTPYLVGGGITLGAAALFGRPVFTHLADIEPGAR